MYKYFSALLLAVVVAGCENDGGSGPSALSGIIVPHTLGNQWVYEESVLNADGTTASSKLDTVRVVQVYLLGDDTVFHFNGGGLTRKVDAVGYWSVYGPQDASLFIKYPVARGEIYKRDTLRPAIINPSPDKDTLYGVYRCEENPATITVPAGTFTAVKYRIDYTSKTSAFEIRDIYYFAPGVGEVYRYHYDWQDNKLTPARKRELVSYELY